MGEGRSIFRPGTSRKRRLTLLSSNGDIGVNDNGNKRHCPPAGVHRTEKDIWQSIESLLRAQQDTLSAQAARFALVSASIGAKLDRIQQAQELLVWQTRPEALQLDLGGPMSQLRDIVRRKKDEGYRYQTYTDITGGVSIGWTKAKTPEVHVPVTEVAASADLEIVRQGGGIVQTAADAPMETVKPVEMQLDELIDMDRLNDEEDYDQFFPYLRNEPEVSPIQAVPMPASSSLSPPPVDDRTLRAGSNLTDIFASIARPARRVHRRTRLTTAPPPLSTLPSVPEAGPSSGRLRPRVKKPDYVHHPMDEVRKRIMRQEAAEAAREREDSPDSVRGLSTAPLIILAKSDGWEKPGAKKWWKWGDNTLRGRMQEISCESCHGRAHFACAGLGESEDMSRDTWTCPDCTHILTQKRRGSPQPVPRAQQERCIRPDCVARSTIPRRKEGDEVRHFVERIIGRRVVSRRVNSTRRYEYLAKWENWEIYDSTWQSSKSFDGTMKMLEEAFLARCMIEGLNERSKVVLLAEAEDFWDENGDLREDVLEELGIPEAEWWPEAKGKYKVRVA